MARMRDLAVNGFSSVAGYQHYCSMARKNFREHLLGEEVRYKKYLYVLRPLLAARWIRDGRGIPPMPFAELAQGTLSDPGLIAEINRLLAVKMRAGEAATSPRWQGIHDFIERELEVEKDFSFDRSDKQETKPLDTFLLNTVLQFENEHAPT